MTDQPRPPLWRVMVEAEHRTPLISGNTGGGQSWLRRKSAAEICAVAVYLEAHGPINTINQPTPRSGPRLLALLEEEARRAERGDLT